MCVLYGCYAWMLVVAESGCTIGKLFPWSQSRTICQNMSFQLQLKCLAIIFGFSDGHLLALGWHWFTWVGDFEVCEPDHGYDQIGLYSVGQDLWRIHTLLMGSQVYLTMLRPYYQNFSWFQQTLSNFWLPWMQIHAGFQYGMKYPCLTLAYCARRCP